jgi:hypothetical protein
MKDRRLGRKVQFDERSRDYPILFKKRHLLQSKKWDCSKHLDQGSEGMCVGTGCGHELIADPVPVDSIDVKYCREQIYWGAQKVDEWPGGAYPGSTNYYEGTSVLAGAKTLKSLGWCEEYLWAFTFDDFCQGLNDGPMIIGVNWYSGMMDTDSKGFIHPTGSVEGGHCVLINEINVEDKYFGGVNSWGTAWGTNGDFKISFDDMERLLAEDGEAVLLVNRKDDPVVPEPVITFWEWLWSLIKSIFGL